MGHLQVFLLFSCLGGPFLQSFFFACMSGHYYYYDLGVPLTPGGHFVLRMFIFIYFSPFGELSSVTTHILNMLQSCMYDIKYESSKSRPTESTTYNSRFCILVAGYAKTGRKSVQN